MRKRFLALLFIATPFLVVGQTNLVDEYLATSNTSAPAVNSQLARHLAVLQTKSYNDSYTDVDLLHKIFRKTQKTFLRSYVPYESFDKIFTSGKYDCLTATALFSILLQEFHFDFDVIETNYHIFIIVHTTNGDVLLETTDRYHGFVQNKKEIEQRIGSYKQNMIASSNANVHYYTYSFQLFKKVTPIQLAGLLHFNQAVNAFNDKKWSLCSDQLDLSAKKYNSLHVKELALLLVQSVLKSDAEEKVKQSILQRFKSEWLEHQPIVANN